MNKPEKLSYESLKKDMCVFLNIPELEKSLKEKMDKFVTTILLSRPQNVGRM